MDSLSNLDALQLVETGVGRGQADVASAFQIGARTLEVPKPSIGHPQRVVEPRRGRHRFEHRGQQAHRLLVAALGEIELSETSPHHRGPRMISRRALEQGPGRGAVSLLELQVRQVHQGG